MKKLPIIGLVIAGVAALFIKKKKAAEPEAAPELQGGAPADDTTPTA